MDILKQLFREEDIKVLRERVPELEKVSPDNIRKIIKLLSDQKCDMPLLRKIIIVTPEVLLRDPSDIEELIYKLKEYNVLKIKEMLENYPLLIMKNAYEVDGYFIKMKNQNKTLEEAREHLEKFPFL